MIRSSCALASCAIFFAASLIGPARASACGGFFCDNSAPVVQNAERIIFSLNGDGTVTAVVQIQYRGPSARFAWVLPVPGTPEVGVSSNVAFTQLSQMTAPSYSMTTRVVGMCRAEPPSGGVDAGIFADAGAAADSASPGGVMVVDSGSVGPFDWVLISLDSTAPDPAAAATTWLTDNGYDLAPSSGELLGPYLAEGMNLIAFRLTKQATAGDIQPIRLTYDASCARIPIKLTAVATQPDMPVLVWVLGDGRAVPTNYFSLELNEALINWFSPSSGYNAVVSAAADEAGGQGFVTEESTTTGRLRPLLTTGQDQWVTATRARPGVSDAELLADAATTFGQWDGFLRVARDRIPLAPGQQVIDALNCLVCGGAGSFCGCPAGGQDLTGFDREAFLTDLDAQVIAPVRDTDTLIHSRANITRLYTTLSAPEMTLDPEFDLNPSLPEVSRLHTAERVIECTPAVYLSEAPSTVTFSDGRTLRIGGGSSWPYRPRESMPAALRVERLSTTGGPIVVRDNSATVDTLLTDHNGRVPPAPDTLPDAGADASDGSTDAGPYPADYAEGACSVGTSRAAVPGFAGLAWIAAALVLVRRRRR